LNNVNTAVQKEKKENQDQKHESIIDNSLTSIDQVDEKDNIFESFGTDSNLQS